ncbi:hypothetical protein J5N97_005581 [Dioscorea zingiberensis]|uniref:BHLH domain-containing protein n=1 Tax=Dioscorea zingiberensis TaxID=325984 RepID=A0A9D5HS10_9LILI|nr:hypothetical protein J5N97_005581 [Dioscorea zingiberensis]
MEGGNDSGRARKAEKLERKIIEKNRRILMKDLLFQLSSIIPNTQYHNESGQQGVLLDEATTYIKKLKERVETLELQKKHRTNYMNNGKVTIFQVRCLDACMDIVIMIRLMNKSFKLGEVMCILEEEGAEVVHANFSNMEDMTSLACPSEPASLAGRVVGQRGKSVDTVLEKERRQVGGGQADDREVRRVGELFEGEFDNKRRAPTEVQEPRDGARAMESKSRTNMRVEKNHAVVRRMVVNTEAQQENMTMSSKGGNGSVFQKKKMFYGLEEMKNVIIP